MAPEDASAEPVELPRVTRHVVKPAAATSSTVPAAQSQRDACERSGGAGSDIRKSIAPTHRQKPHVIPGAPPAVAETGGTARDR